MTREEIIKIFYNENNKIIAQRTTKKYLTDHNYLDLLTNYYKDSTSIRETLYRIKNNIDIRPVCKICGKPVSFNTYGYFSTYCSKKCSNSDPIVLQKNKDNVSKSLKKAYQERGNEIKEKRKNSLFEHYGQNVTSPFAIQKIQEKSMNTILSKYGVHNVFELNIFRRTREQMQQDSIEYQKKRGYNIEYINSNDSHKKLQLKVYNGCNIHGDIYMDWTLFNNRTRDTRKNYTILCPICNPIKKHETTLEVIIKNLLDKYNIQYIQYDRKQIKPYELDFYLTDYNIAIECNGSYWHAGYDNFLKHTKKIELCKNKNIKLIYYWSYQIYNDIDNVEIDLCNQLGIKLEKNYTNNIIKIKDNITYYMYSFINLYDINVSTKYIAIPEDKDLLNNYLYTIDAFPYFVNYREECIVNDVSININDIDFLLQNTVQKKGISICWTTNFNVYKI